MFLVLNNIGRR